MFLITETECVYCAVRTECLNLRSISVSKLFKVTALSGLHLNVSQLVYCPFPFKPRLLDRTTVICPPEVMWLSDESVSCKRRSLWSTAPHHLNSGITRSSDGYEAIKKAVACYGSIVDGSYPCFLFVGKKNRLVHVVEVTSQENIRTSY